MQKRYFSIFDEKLSLLLRSGGGWFKILVFIWRKLWEKSIYERSPGYWLLIVVLFLFDFEIRHFIFYFFVYWYSSHDTLTFNQSVSFGSETQHNFSYIISINRRKTRNRCDQSSRRGCILLLCYHKITKIWSLRPPLHLCLFLENSKICDCRVLQFFNHLLQSASTNKVAGRFPACKWH